MGLELADATSASTQALGGIELQQLWGKKAQWAWQAFPDPSPRPGLTWGAGVPRNSQWYLGYTCLAPSVYRFVVLLTLLHPPQTSSLWGCRSRWGCALSTHPGAQQLPPLGQSYSPRLAGRPLGD